MTSDYASGSTEPQAQGFLSFWEFFQAFVDCQKISLPLKKMHEEVCNVLQQVVLGQMPDYQFVVINIMPRVGKTKIMEALAAWTFAYFPDAQIIGVSYSAELAERSARYVRDVLNEPWYKQLFGVELGEVQKSHYFTTSAKGSYYSAGVGGTITGFGAGLKRPAGGYIGVDDPANPNEALSKVETENIKIFFENTLRSRRNSTDYTPIIVVAQRLSTDDLPGYLIEKYPDTTLHLCYPALDPVTEESNFPETISTMELKQMRDGPAAFTYASQYAQSPVVFGGNLIKTEDFMEHDFDDRGTGVKWEYKIVVADTAMKAKRSADNSVLQCWGKLKGKFYLLDQMHGKWDSPALLSNAQLFWRKHHVSGSSVRRFYIEDKASGTGLIQQLRKLGLPVKEIQVLKDKVTRVQDILGYIAAHLVFIPKAAAWKAAFVSECAAFRADGKQVHDDQVDTMSHALSVMGGSTVTIYDVLQAEKAKGVQMTTKLSPIAAQMRLPPALAQAMGR